jgi:F-type H+-transporting ATPase subunit delta
MRSLKSKDYAKILYELVNSSQDNLDEAIEIFYEFIIHENVLSKVDKILEEYTNLSEQEGGLKKMEVITSTELDKTEVDNLQNKFGENVKLSYKVDRNLLGGVVVMEKNKLYDASLRYQLNRLKNHLE